MRIVAARSVVVGNPWKNWVFVILETDEGIQGLGEATGGLSTKPIESWLEELSPLYIGQDPREVQAVLDNLVKGLFLSRNPAVTGVELACWDILGKALGVPVWRLLGGRANLTVPLYANGWYQGPRDPSFFAERAVEVVALGYAALKFDPFGDAYGDLPPRELRRSLAIVRAVREAVGEEVELLIEAHDRFHLGTALKVGRALADFDVGWLEAPVASSDLGDLATVAGRVPVPVAAGERTGSLEEFARLVRSGIAVAQPEVLRLGGFLPGVKAAALAEAANLPVAPHNAQSPYLTVVNLHLAAVVANFKVLECFDQFLEPWSGDLLSGHAELYEGQAKVPAGPGFGLQLDESVAALHPYGKQNFLRLFQPGWEWRNRPHDREEVGSR